MRLSSIVVVIALLAGCASTPPGVTMSDEERAACAEQGCTVWTEAELSALAQALFMRGAAAAQSRRPTY